MLDESKFSEGEVDRRINLTKFVSMLQFNRRWTYTGSLTTAPFSEGILWNVVEHVIPLRQSTLDLFLEYRKLEESKFFNKFENE
jgi:carbonic anhydrase